MESRNMKRMICDDGMYDFFEQLVESNERLEHILGTPADDLLNCSSLSDKRIEQLYVTLRANYTESEAKEQILLIDHVDRFLNGYFQIDGLSYLLISNYNEIENNIFYEIEAKKGRQKMIREHFRHQFRNSYLSAAFMLDFELLDKMVLCVEQSNSPICEYIAQTAQRMSRDDEKKYQIKEKEIVFKSVFIASLFHDIGYPLAYFFRNVQQIHEFTPYMKIVSPNVKATYAELRSLLNASFLFNHVDDEEIQDKYNKNDHGVLSALGFLLHFYTSGRIYSLNAADKCVIELAANAIYHHTDHNDKTPFVFEYDPVSFVVRLCDDLQEWERFYLLIDNRHNYLKCTTCGKLMKNSGRIYECTGCKKSYEKITAIRNRKVNYIDFCKKIDITEEKLQDRHQSKITIEIDYDCYAQLELLVNDYEVIVRRKADIERLNRLLKNQKFLPQIVVRDRVLSTNPINLLENLFQKYEFDDEKIELLINQTNGKEKKNLKKFFAEYLEKKKSRDYFGKDIEVQNFVYPKRRREFLETYMGEIHTLKKLIEANENKV